MKVVILCGGGGTRLWPLSRENKPKQFHRLIKNYSLLQDTILRVSKNIPLSSVFISTNENFVDEIKFQLFEIPEENIIAEPMKMDSSAAIGLALTHIAAKGGDENEPIIFLPSDHIFENEVELSRLISEAEKFCTTYPDKLLTFGVRPTYPATSYGYIKLSHNEITDGIFSVEKFVEKPDLETAKVYANSWEYLWNLGIFAMSRNGFLELYEKYLPDTYSKLQSLLTHIGKGHYQLEVTKIYPTLDKISIDYGIIEKMSDICVIPADNLGWRDIGNFEELYYAQTKYFDENENVKKGNIMTQNTKRSLIYGGEKKLIAVVGCEDLVVVDTEDALLIIPRDKAPNVKTFIDEVKKKNLSHYL